MSVWVLKTKGKIDTTWHNYSLAQQIRAKTSNFQESLPKRRLLLPLVIPGNPCPCTAPASSHHWDGMAQWIYPLTKQKADLWKVDAVNREGAHKAVQNLLWLMRVMHDFAMFIWFIHHEPIRSVFRGRILVTDQRPWCQAHFVIITLALFLSICCAKHAVRPERCPWQ